MDIYRQVSFGCRFDNRLAYFWRVDRPNLEWTESVFYFHFDADSASAIADLQDVARKRGNVFEELMQTVKSNSLGQISAALYEVGGEYRRNM